MLLSKIKLLKVVSKVLPLFLSSIIILHSIIYYMFNIDLRVFSLLGGSSLIVIIYLYLVSWIFNFCFYQKIFLYYLTFVQIITIIDEYFNIPVSDKNYYIVMYTTFGCTIILYAILKVKDNRNTNKKIKELEDKYNNLLSKFNE